MPIFFQVAFRHLTNSKASVNDHTSETIDNINTGQMHQTSLRELHAGHFLVKDTSMIVTECLYSATSINLSTHTKLKFC